MDINTQNDINLEQDNFNTSYKNYISIIFISYILVKIFYGIVNKNIIQPTNNEAITFIIAIISLHILFYMNNFNKTFEGSIFKDKIFFYIAFIIGLNLSVFIRKTIVPFYKSANKVSKIFLIFFSLISVIVVLLSNLFNLNGSIITFIVRIFSVLIILAGVYFMQCNNKVKTGFKLNEKGEPVNIYEQKGVTKFNPKPSTIALILLFFSIKPTNKLSKIILGLLLGIFIGDMGLFGFKLPYYTTQDKECNGETNCKIKGVDIAPTNQQLASNINNQKTILIFTLMLIVIMIILYFILQYRQM